MPFAAKTSLSPSSDVTTFSLEQVLRALGLDYAASLLDATSQKAIARGDPPTSLLDALMREELRAQLEHKARLSLKRSCIFPLTTVDTYDFDYPKQIDRELCHRAATLDFVREKANVVFIGPSGVGKTH